MYIYIFFRTAAIKTISTWAIKSAWMLFLVVLQHINTVKVMLGLCVAPGRMQIRFPAVCESWVCVRSPVSNAVWVCFLHTQWASQTGPERLHRAMGNHQTAFVSVDIPVLSFRIRAHHPNPISVTLCFRHSCPTCAWRVSIVKNKHFLLFEIVSGLFQWFATFKKTQNMMK